MAEQDVLDKLDDVLDEIADNKEKLAEIEAKTDAISTVTSNTLKRSMSQVFTCRACHGIGCEVCDNTGLVPRSFSSQ
jgi:hypothetical protein